MTTPSKKPSKKPPQDLSLDTDTDTVITPSETLDTPATRFAYQCLQRLQRLRMVLCAKPHKKKSRVYFFSDFLQVGTNITTFTASVSDKIKSQDLSSATKQSDIAISYVFENMSVRFTSVEATSDMDSGLDLHASLFWKNLSWSGKLFTADDWTRALTEFMALCVSQHKADLKREERISSNEYRVPVTLDKGLIEDAIDSLGTPVDPTDMEDLVAYWNKGTEVRELLERGMARAKIEKLDVESEHVPK